MWSSDGLVLFRHAAMLECEDDEGEGQLTLDHAQAVVEAAIDCCERYYPVFQFVLWGGKSPSDALAASLGETVGEACITCPRWQIGRASRKERVGEYVEV